MPRDLEPSQNEKQFFAKALAENIRLDGRQLDQFRDLDIECGDEYGVVDVRLGKTRVQARISAELVPPFPDRPFDGLFTITTELSPMTLPTFEVNRPSETEILLSRILEKTVRRSQALDTESLCLVAGSKVWSIRADVHILSHDGNLIDTSSIAVITALQHFRKPDTSILGQEITVYTPAERDPVPLSILHSPVCITFSFYRSEEEQQVLLDTTMLEEQLREGSCTISMNRHGEVCQIAKLGGVTVDALLLLSCVKVAELKVKEISALLTKKLEEDARRRDKGGVIAGLLSAENERVS